MTRASGEHGYGRYVIRTLAAGETVRARAFLGSKAVADAEGHLLDDALRAMRAVLDDRDARQRGARKSEVPTADEFADAFAQHHARIGEHHWLMLRALMAAPGRTMTATGLAAAAGYSSYASANEKFGKLARLVAEELGYEPERRADGSPIWTMTLATGADPAGHGDDGLWRWTMRAEVAECLLRMNIGAVA